MDCVFTTFLKYFIAFIPYTNHFFHYQFIFIAPLTLTLALTRTPAALIDHFTR